MLHVTIDDRRVDVPEGATVLDAARAAGVAIPTLCHLDGFAPDPSCYVCVVQVEGRAELCPSCATPVVDGMVVRTNTDEVRVARRTALELLLSDHAGDCVAPCTLACPAHLDVADFIRAVTCEDDRRAVEIIKRTIALPASLGRICPRFCENACRRKAVDGQPVAICSLRRFAADRDLRSPKPYVPERAPATGRRVAICGAGPAGLSAAYYLLQMGHACVLFEARDRAGGMFRHGVADWRLPRDVLDAEIETVLRLGAELQTGTRLGADVTLDALRGEFDAVLVAVGALTVSAAPEAVGPGEAGAVDVDTESIRRLGLEPGPRGAEADRHTGATPTSGVFAAGNVVTGPNYGVHAVAAGRRAAVSIDQFLRGEPVRGETRHVNVLLRDLSEAEVGVLAEGTSDAQRVLLDDDEPDHTPRGLTETEARTEAGRCLDCDCSARRACALREASEAAGASAGRYRGARRAVRRDTSNPEVVFEPGKCIQCGRCVRIAEAERERLGLAFVGRGFTVTTAAPFSESLAAGLERTALRCAEACPTGALSLKRST